MLAVSRGRSLREAPALFMGARGLGGGAGARADPGGALTRPWRRCGKREAAAPGEREGLGRLRVAFCMLRVGSGGAGAHMCSPSSARGTRELQFEHLTDGSIWDMRPAGGWDGLDMSIGRTG